MHGNPWYICSYCARESGEEKRRKIEAYDALAKENEELRTKTTQMSDVIEEYVKQITSLRESLKLAVEALNEWLFWESGQIYLGKKITKLVDQGNEALATIKAKGEL
jgi:hypothetical protein